MLPYVLAIYFAEVPEIVHHSRWILSRGFVEIYHSPPSYTFGDTAIICLIFYIVPPVDDSGNPFLYFRDARHSRDTHELPIQSQNSFLIFLR